MISVRIPKTLEDIENLYTELQTQRRNDYIHLKLSTNLTFNSFSTLTSLIQFIITWQKLENSGKLVINGSVIEDSDLDQITKRLYGFIASIISWENGVIDTNGRSLTSRIRQFNAERKDLLKNGEFNSIAFGDTILIPFFDHVPPTEGLFSIAYKGLLLKDEKEFLKLTNTIISIATKNNAYTRPFFDSIKNTLNGILFELFENTHKWATTTRTGSFIRPSVRGVFAKFYKFDKNRVEKYAKESKGLSAYFTSLLKILRSDINKEFKYVSFIEISVFDSGSGLVEIFSDTSLDDLSIEKEYQFLIDCLKKNKTSHRPISENLVHGSGLHRIMKLLDSQKGFLRIRSGRLNLYRNFFSVPFYPLRSEGRDDLANYTLLDWQNNSSKSHDWSKSSGTLLTMIIPVFVENVDI